MPPARRSTSATRKIAGTLTAGILHDAEALALMPSKVEDPRHGALDGAGRVVEDVVAGWRGRGLRLSLCLSCTCRPGTEQAMSKQHASERQDGGQSK